MAAAFIRATEKEGALPQGRSSSLPVQQEAQGGDSAVPLCCQHQAQPILQQGTLQEREEESFGAALHLNKSLSLSDERETGATEQQILPDRASAMSELFVIPKAHQYSSCPL